MKKIAREDIVSNEKYREMRNEFRDSVMAAKDSRRVIIPPYLTFLFENTLTMRYQVQEMMRAESIADEKAIQHEIKTYNGLIPDEGEISATLMIEINDPAVRAVKLNELVGLENHIFLEWDGGGSARAEFDESQLDPEKISSVQYIRFRLGKDGAEAFQKTGRASIKTTHPGCSYEQELTRKQLEALIEDLS